MRNIRIYGLHGFIVRVVTRLVAAPVARSVRRMAATYSQLEARVRRQFERDARSSLADFLSDPTAGLRFALSPEPTVSIVVLTYNRAAYTYRCLEAILRHADVAYELIIVDNASQDETRPLLERLENVIILRNPINEGFGGGCNQAAQIAKGRYLLLLNNDAALTAGCLRALVDTVTRVSDCGAVGCKIITLDGRLQEAGSIIWDDGATQGYGRQGNPSAPEFSYLREVDYCSAACLLVRADVWKRIGGFDHRYHPAYFEDADLCMSIRALGLRVLYQPAAVALHQEHTSSSPRNARTLMFRNRTLFAEKWSHKLASQPLAATRDVLRARDRAPYPALLVIDDRIDSPDYGSGMGRTWAALTMLADMPYRVTYIPLWDPTPREPMLTELQQLGIEVIAGHLKLKKFARERANFYDALIVSRPHNMHRAAGILRQRFPKAPLIYDAEALYFVREELRAAVLGRKLNLMATREQRALETTLLRAADLVIAVSEHERDMILSLVPELDGRVFVWGHPAAVRPTRCPFDARSGVLFIGSFPFADSPNEHAVSWLLDNVFPAVAHQLTCTFRIVGRAPEVLQRRASGSVDFAGFVPDLEPEYDRHRIFVVPNQFSAGIPLKLIEAMSRGIPAVVSELTARQLGLVDGEAVLIGRTPEEFARKIARLYGDPALWQLVRDGALRYVAQHCDPEKLKAELRDLLARAAAVKSS
jgi:GT2 family glycosyltransferase/glycosyltransferase involved in cell wall biosynthesis